LILPALFSGLLIRGPSWHDSIGPSGLAACGESRCL
jgi:hypothetical protein